MTLYVADPLRPRLVLQPWEAPTSVDTQLDLLILLLACSIMFNNFHLQLEDSLHLSAINENRCLRTRRGSYPQLVVSLIRYYSKLCVFSSRFQDAFHSCAWGCKVSKQWRYPSASRQHSVIADLKHCPHHSTNFRVRFTAAAAAR